MNRVLIIGCGDIGLRVARLALAEGAAVTGLVRSEPKGDWLKAQGVTPLLADFDDPATLTGLPTAGAVVYYLAPPPGGGYSDPRARNFCAAVASGGLPAKLVYVSTSGVYGDCGNDLVTEQTPVNPQTSRARRRLDAEQTLLAWGLAQGVPVVILRVTGIYGPGRLPVSRLLAGHPVLREEESPSTNRIHADDLARVCFAAAAKAGHGEVFNVSDGEGGTMSQYFFAVADALQLSRPAAITMAQARQVMNPLMLSYLNESRRMSNAKMLKELGITLRYPTLAAGLQAVVAGMGDGSELLPPGRHD
ncbi:MAG: SDR family oxidoreductase [Trichloromonadaceae bacterium]